MRTRSKLRLLARITTLAMGVALLLSLATVPAHAATTVPGSSITLTPAFLASAKLFTVRGQLNSRFAGQRITLEVRKPGRTYWSVIATPLIRAGGVWSFPYTPKLGGKFYLRARYNRSLSRTASLTVLRGPGVRYQILLASTTSTRDSGLFERLGPAFLASVRVRP
jgi:hypothetical protein